MWTPFFSSKRIQDIRPTIQKIVDDTLDSMTSKPQPIDFVSEFALVVSSLMICLLLDVPYDDHEFFQKHSRNRSAADASAEEVATAISALSNYWLEKIEEREKNPGSDLVSQIVVSEVLTNGITRQELAGNAQLMLLAGHETTSKMIGLGTLTLLQHPDQLEALKTDSSLVSGAVDELMRFLSIPQNGLSRIAAEDVEVGGQLIRKGEGVLTLLSAANRDDAMFPNPDVFDIRRPARQQIAFGAGPHQCVGSALARAEMQIVFGTLFRRLPNLRIAVPPEDIKYRYDDLFFGVHSLPVAW
jgi:cytochrome P450